MPLVSNSGFGGKFVTFFGMTVVSTKFLKRPTEGSMSSGLIIISSSLNVTLKTRFGNLKRQLQVHSKRNGSREKQESEVNKFVSV